MSTMSAVDHVVLCVFDGLRPDMVTPALTPNLARFAAQGTWFREARSVFPSVTRVATTSIATGAPPAVHGIVGNAFLYPQVTREHALDTGLTADLLLAEAATGNRLVTAATFGDALAQAGKRLAVVHTGSAGSAYLINPRARSNGHWTFSILGREHSQTPEAVDEVVARFGPLPARTLPRFEELDYAATVLTEHVLAEMKPDVSLIWFNEPDTSYHYKFLGGPETLAVLAHVDAAFGRILDWVDAQPDADRYAVIAASDHGHISTSERIDVAASLRDEGHRAVEAAERRLDGAHVSVTGGRMGEIRILDGSTARRNAIAAWLLEQPFLGMLFSPARNEIEGEIAGSFASSLVGFDHAREPDLAFVLHSSEADDLYGYPGLGLFTGSVPVGGGMHGGLNRHEINTVLMVRGGGMTAGRVDRGAAGIVDIAPTILDLVGLPPAPTMAGQSLASPLAETDVQVFETGAGGFKQALRLSDVSARGIIEAGERI